MKQTTFPQHGNSLLNYAISRLSPDVFSHPVWMRFGRRETALARGRIDDLLSAAGKLQAHDPGAACQVLLICAAYQTYVDQHYQALKTTQQALALAERNGFTREIIWALWGACAISVRQGNYEQAASYLLDLKATLSEQTDWMLADFVDVVRQSLFQPGTIFMGPYSGRLRNDSYEDQLSFTFDWLQHWGFSSQGFERELQLTSGQPARRRTKQGTLRQSFLSIQHWQGRWHTLLLAIRGEFRLQWAEHEPRSTNRRPALRESLAGLLRARLFRPKGDAAVSDETSQIPAVDLLPSATGTPPQKAKSHRKRTAPGFKEPKGDRRPAPASTIVPVAVHMLGTFSIMIGELRVKLPASRGLSVLKYLLLHHKQTVPREVLMDVFWPDSEPETARNNLNVAMHSLRKALRAIVFLPVIVYEDGAYGLEPNLQVWLDVEEFERCLKAGHRLEARDQLTAAVTEYESAISLYQGDFLEQNPYEEWTVLERERLRVAYLDTLDRLSQIYFNQERYAACIRVCQLILGRDSCCEDAHCLLMRCYSRRKQYHLVSRQYQICLEALSAELDVEPTLETTQLYDRIRRREHV